MKLNLFGIAAVAMIVYSCGAKKAAQTSNDGDVVTEIVKEEVIQATRMEAKSEASTAAVLNENQLFGKKVYENNCGKCHKLFETNSFSKEEWKPIVIRMQKKAHISDEETAAVLEYVTASL
ncbi:hypothetical protein [Flavobacterium sp.]|uniref:hypothetical protein n=1 Tax=Flavobacterium sp. TaxID=239 RepID=UPI0028BEC99B|nr:hypothetical protein [Flavobacterium sp.]